MAVKTFRQLFNTFKGVHERFTHLTRPLEYAVRCKNLILDDQNNLVGRFGHKSMAGTSAVGDACHKQPSYGLHNYQYQALDGSGLIEEVVGIGNHFFRIKKGTFTVEYTGAATTADISHHVLNNVWTFELREDGVAVSTTTISSWTYRTDPGTLGAYKTIIDALSGWACTVTGLARVNGTQTGRDFNNVITVDSGHTITVDTDRATMLAFYQTLADLRWFPVVETTATTLRLKPKTSTASSIAVTDNTYLGTGLVPIYALPYFYQANCKGDAVSFDFYYWERVPWGSDRVSYHDGFTDATQWILAPETTSLSPSNVIRYFPGSPEFQNYKLVTYDNTVYTAAQGSIGQYGERNLFTGTRTPGRKSGLLQYDGQSWHQAIMPKASFSAADTGAGSLAAGTYKYIARLKYIDYQENEHFGPDSIQSRGEPVSVAVGASRQVTLTLSNLTSITSSTPAPSPPLRTNVADNAGTQAFTANTPVAITVLSGSNTDREYGLYVGDTAAFLNADTNQIVRGPVTAITYVGATSYTITVTLPEDGEIADGSLISNNFTYEIFRTAPNNNQFYYLAEIPIAVSLTENYIDDEADVTGNALYDGPFTGAFRRDVPPQISTLEVHQGLLMGAGDPDRPNSLYWCNADDPWSWSASTNETTVTPGGGGPITAIASSDDNTLAVFGDKGVNFIAGDFASGAISEIKKYHGDCGCPSRHGAIKIRDELWWLSYRGPRRAQGALLLPSVENFVQTLRNQDSKLVFGVQSETGPLVKKCVAINDENNQFALWAVPAYLYAGTTDGATVTDSSIEIYYDYENQFFSLWQYGLVTTDSLIGAGGMCTFEGKLLKLLLRQVFKQSGDYINSSTQFYKWNFLEPLKVSTEYDLLLAYDSTGEPSVDKQFLRLKLYTEADSDTFSAWQTTVTTNRNFNLTGNTNTAITLSSASTYETEAIKLASEKARAMQFRLLAYRGVSNSYEAGPKYTGIEYEVAIDYKKEEVQKT